MQFSGLLFSFAISFGLLIVAMTVHEFAHARVAYALGDQTARFSGRLTLNPLAHIDPVWTVIIPLVLFMSSGGRFIFGAAKPVPVNYWALRNPKRDMIWVGLSGPLANIVLATLLSPVLHLLPAGGIIHLLLVNLIAINVVLGVFNLIPIPPLDGSRIVSGILPRELAYRYAALEPYGFLIIIVLMWMGLLNMIVWPLVEAVLRIMGV